MLSTLGALIPTFGLVVTGFILKRSGFPGDSFWPLADKLTYYLLLPALLVVKLATADLAGNILLPMASILLGATTGIAVFLLLIRFILPISIPAFTSVFQGSFRPNTYIGLAVASALLGDKGLSLAAVAMGILTPYVNLLSVGVMSYFLASSPTEQLKKIGVQIIKNPLIIACIVGLGWNTSGTGFPFLLEEWMTILSRAALPMGLLSVGAGLSLRSISGQPLAIFISSGLKLFALPFLALYIGNGWAVDPSVLQICVIFTAIPCSVSSYILATQLGGDHVLMAGILTIQTLLAIFSMPVVLAFL
ncbi:MAG: AEC family transporter [Bacteroidota bacterium]